MSPNGNQLKSVSGKMNNFLTRVSGLKGNRNTSEFARFLGVNQKSLDQMLKGERKPSVQMVYTICLKCSVSADWLLSLPVQQEKKKSGKHHPS